MEKIKLKRKPYGSPTEGQESEAKTKTKTKTKAESKTKTKTKAESISCGAVAPRDDQDINDVINAFGEVNLSYRKYFANTTQRAASGRLIKTYGKDKILQVIAILEQSNRIPYAPVITTPVELENKFAALTAFFQRSQFKFQAEIPKITKIR